MPPDISVYRVGECKWVWKTCPNSLQDKITPITNPHWLFTFERLHTPPASWEKDRQQDNAYIMFIVWLVETGELDV